MRKTLVAGLLLFSGALYGWAAPPPPDQSSAGNDTEMWGDASILGQTTLKVVVRGQRISLPAYATSLGDEFMIRADQPELLRIATLFGARLEWDSQEEVSRCHYHGQTRLLKLDQRKVQGPTSVTGKQEAELPISAQAIENQAHIPLSALEDFLDVRVTVRPNQQVFIEPLVRSVRFEGTSQKPRLVIDSTAPVTCRTFTLKNPSRYVIDVAGAVLDTPSLTVQHPDLGNVRLGQFELGPAISRIVIPTGEGVQVRQETWGARETLAWQMQVPTREVVQSPAPSEALEVQDVRLEKTEKGHRLVLSGSQAMHYEWQRMGSPNPRWWLDIPQANLKAARHEFEVEGKYQGQIRLSQNQPQPNPVVRVVVDLDQAVEVNTSVGENEKQLVIDILDKEVDPNTALSKGRGTTESTPAVAGGTPSGLIVIDPGHGGSDCGAQNKSINVNEASVTLDICKRLAQILKAQGWNVVLTRTTDVDVSYSGSSAREELGARAKVANDAKADIFLSVHCNASVSPSSNGTSLHYYKQSDYVLANELQGAVLNATGRANRGLQANRFYVLAHTQMPAVLVETAFITNPTEGALLNDPNYRQKIAEGLAQGLRQYASRQLDWGTANK